MFNHPSTDRFKLSILDIATMHNGQTAAQTLREMTELVQLADSLGYTRYWFAEHHNSKNQVSASPDLLIAHAAAHSRHMRVGAGGVMLPNHSPLKVVEDFSLLESLHPRRIDLGIGRAPGTDGLTALALRRSREAVMQYDFPEQLDELLAFFSNDFPTDHPFRRITAMPGESAVPDIYMLGSSSGGMQFAVQKGLGFAFAAHISPPLAIPMLRAYREHFKPSAFMKEPKSILSIIVVTAETDEEAAYLAGPVELYWTRLSTGNASLPFPSLEEARSHVYSPAEEAARRENKDRYIVGNVKSVAERLRAMAKEALVDEIMLMEFYPDAAARHRAYKLLAEEFELTPTDL